MRKIYIYLYFIVLFYFLNILNAFGQGNWIRVGNLFNRALRCLYGDTINNLLYAGGEFYQCGPDTINGIAVWNGVKWDSLAHGEYNTYPVRSIGAFQNNIYASGHFSSNYNNYIASWNGIIWDTSSLELNGPPCRFAEYNNEFYLIGNYSSLNSLPCSSLSKFDGNNWYCFPFNFAAGSNTGLALAFYYNNLYFGGSFAVNGIIDLLKWDGLNTYALGQGILGGLTSVNSLMVYKNELYIGGYFSMSDGNPSNNIMKWNGTSLSNVGIGVDGTIYDMAVFNDELYVVGVFDHAGGIPASRIAKWNGTYWSALSNENFDNAINALCFFNNELYVGGAFRMVDNDTISYLAKYTGLLSIDDNKFSRHINIFPNPTTGKFTLTFPVKNQHKTSLVISDLIGRHLKEHNLNNQGGNYDFDMREFDNGIYLVSIVSDGVLTTAKVILNE